MWDLPIGRSFWWFDRYFDWRWLFSGSPNDDSFDFHVLYTFRGWWLHPHPSAVSVALTAFFAVFSSFLLIDRYISQYFRVSSLDVPGIYIPINRENVCGFWFVITSASYLHIYHRNVQKAHKSWFLYKHHNFYTIINTS